MSQVLPPAILRSRAIRFRHTMAGNGNSYGILGAHLRDVSSGSRSGANHSCNVRMRHCLASAGRPDRRQHEPLEVSPTRIQREIELSRRMLDEMLDFVDHVVEGSFAGMKIQVGKLGAQFLK